jgi:hypothetical protein
VERDQEALALEDMTRAGTLLPPRQVSQPCDYWEIAGCNVDIDKPCDNDILYSSI